MEQKTKSEKELSPKEYYREMEKIGLELGFKPGFPAAKFKAKFGRWPTEEEKS